MANICQKITSYLPKLTDQSVSRFTYGGSALLGMGAGLATSGFAGGMIIGTIAAGTAYMVGPQMKRACKWIRPEPIDLGPPRSSPLQIQWEGNSCFISSALSSFVLNEPVVLRELPQAILRKIDATLALPPDRDYAFIHRIRNAPRPLNRNHFETLLRGLQKLENSDPVKLDENLQKLLSLLELYEFAVYSQENEKVEGKRVNLLRKAAGRFHPDFENGDYGDSAEWIHTMGNLIFEDSPHSQVILNRKYYINTWTGRAVQPVSDTLQGDEWGFLSFPMEASIDQGFGDFLAPPPYPSGQRWVNVVEQNYFDHPPEFFVVNRKNNLDLRTLHPIPLNPIPVSRFLAIRPAVFINPPMGEERYELTGFSRHLGRKSHYDSFVRARDGEYYHCDDMEQREHPPKVVTEEEFLEGAQTASTLIYRKINL